MDYITPVMSSGQSDYDDSHLLGEQLVLADDGRAVVAQAWAESGDTFLTYYFSDQGLESASSQDLYDYLVQHGFKIGPELRYSSLRYVDQVGNTCWRFTIVIGESDE